MPVHEKGGHQCVKNYRQVSLLPVFSKIFKGLIYKIKYKGFLPYKSILQSKSIIQLLYKYQIIIQAFYLIRVFYLIWIWQIYSLTNL